MNPFHISYYVGFARNGEIKAVDALLSANCGFSSDLSGPITDRALFHSDNCYFYPNVRLISRPLKTNKVSNTAFRGFGGPQGMMLAERVIQEVAFFLGKDPLDIRKMNLYGTGKKSISYSAAMNDLQLSLYQLAIRENYKDSKSISLNWYYLREDKIVKVEHNEQKISELKNKILYLIEKIKSDKDFIAKKSILCDWCYFWEECEVMSCENPAKKL